jgi:lipopolysaccharide heptosyltransferase II
MNILQILPELNVGGVETGTLDLARQLVRLGHKAVVVSNGGDLVADLESCGAKHYKLGVHNKSIFSIFKMIPKLCEIIKGEEIDIVHARSRVPAWIGYFAARRTSRVFITTCHGYYKRHPASAVMGWAKRVIAISNVVARNMIDNFGVAYDDIRLIPRSVNLEKFQFIRRSKNVSNEFNVGIIGRITPLKGHIYFIKAMAKVARVVPGLKIWIVGDASSSKEGYKEQIRVLVRRLGLKHCTEFLGTQKDIPAILKNLDLLVLATTTQEAFGRVIIEAQACGVPVVATSVGGVVDIIEDGKNGILVPAADPDAIALAAIKIFGDRELADSLAENARKKVEKKYSTELMAEKTIAVYKEALNNFRVLIIKFSSVGDVILSTAAIRAIREKFAKGYKITFLVAQEAKEILLRCPYIDELLVCNFKGKDKGLFGFLKLATSLRKRNFDMVVDLQNNRKSHLLAHLTFSPQRYGYNNKKFGFLLNRRIKDSDPNVDPLTHQFRVLKLLGIELIDRRLQLWPSLEDRKYIENFLSSGWLSANQKMIGINLSASLRWDTKAWPLQHIIKLCEYLGKRGIRVVITGTEKDLETADYVVESISNFRPLNACGKTTINQLGCLIQRCSVYVSGDSAPLHIASAVNTPAIALFGPTDPQRHLPLNKNITLIQKAFSCAPCYKSKCRHKRCMSSISAEEVLEIIDKLLK